MIPSDIQKIITGSDFSLNIFDYIPFKNLSIYPTFLTEFEYSPSNSELESFRINYESTIDNSYSFFLWLFIIVFLHFIIYVLWVLFSKLKNKNSCIIKVINWWLTKIFYTLTFGYYIRSFLEISQYILISSISEIYNSNTADISRSISFSFACLMIIFYIILIWTVNYLIFSNYIQDEKELNKLEEFFNCLQENKKWRFCISMLLIRRLLFVVILITLTSISSRQVIGALISLQFFYYWWLLYTRPYKEIKENVIEILNETFFNIILVIWILFNTQDDWNEVKTSITMWMLLSNSILVFLIIISKIIILSI